MTKPIGPELPTLSERFVGLFHLSHVVGSGVVGLVLLALGPLNILTNFLEGFDVRSFTLATLTAPQVVLLSMFPISWAYVFYMPQYMRRKVLEAEQALSPLLPNGKSDFRELFGRISALKPQLFLLALTLLFTSSGSLQSSLPWPRLIADAIFGIIIFVGLVSMCWTYYGSLRGIHKMGAVSLALRPYQADATLGLRPVGSLALSLATVYFGFIGLFWAFITIGSYAFAFDPGFLLSQYALFSFLTFLGLLLFFFPLNRLHKRMVQQKRIEKDTITEKLVQRLQNPTEATSSGDLSQVLILEMIERKVSSIATWPFDTSILGKLTIIVLSVVATLIARAIAIFLRI